MHRLCDLPDCDRPHRAKGLCTTHYTHVFGRKVKLVDLTCAYCGAVVRRVQRSDRGWITCSIECHKAHFSALAAIKRSARSQIVKYPGIAGSCPVPPSHQSRRRDGLTTGGRTVLVAGDCTRCGTPTVSRIAEGGAELVHLTCSRTCSSRMAKDRRRALIRAAYVEPIYRAKVYARDGWVCQLCHLPVDRDARVPDPRAPTVDHIIPLAPYQGRPGGLHSMANAQIAHFLCNSLKSYLV